MKVVSDRLPLTLSVLLSLVAGSAAAADYSAKICALSHPQLTDAVEVSEGVGTGCQWSTPDGGLLVLTVGDSDLDALAAQSRQELDDLQASFAGVMGVKVSRGAMGICGGDELVDVTARGQSTVKGWARCGERLLFISAEGAGTPEISKTMVKAIQAAGL
ncbi:MAG: hypothetical protein II007_14765 [Gammaproteobacteria bacterium]|nr:hypothetical protein [Gammaproteobacteria bacterium]